MQKQHLLQHCGVCQKKPNLITYSCYIIVCLLSAYRIHIQLGFYFMWQLWFLKLHLTCMTVHECRVSFLISFLIVFNAISVYMCTCCNLLHLNLLHSKQKLTREQILLVCSKSSNCLFSTDLCPQFRLHCWATKHIQTASSLASGLLWASPLFDYSKKQAD